MIIMKLDIKMNPFSFDFIVENVTKYLSRNDGFNLISTSKSAYDNLFSLVINHDFIMCDKIDLKQIRNIELIHDRFWMETRNNVNTTIKLLNEKYPFVKNLCIKHKNTNKLFLKIRMKKIKFYGINGIIRLPDGIEEVEFYGKCENKITMPQSVKKIYLSRESKCKFNIPKNIVKLVLKNNSNNKEFDFSNTSIKILKLDHSYNYDLKLPHTIEELECGDDFNKSLDLRHTNIKILRLGFSFNSELFLPNTIKELVFGDNFDSSSLDLRHTEIKILKLGNYFQGKLFLPNTIKELVFGVWFDRSLDLRHTEIRILELGREFNSELFLPSTTRKLFLGSKFNKKINLPEGLETLQIGECFNQKFEMPPFLKKLLIFNENYTENVILPDTIQELIYPIDCKAKIKFPDKFFNCKSRHRNKICYSF